MNDLSNLTLDSLVEMYNLLPPVLSQMSVLIPVQSKINEALSMQLEALNIPVYRSAYLPRQISRVPRRSHYKTRAGYRHARNYWRSFDREQERMFASVGYLFHEAARKTETAFVNKLFYER